MSTLRTPRPFESPRPSERQALSLAGQQCQPVTHGVGRFKQSPRSTRGSFPHCAEASLLGLGPSNKTGRRPPWRRARRGRGAGEGFRSCERQFLHRLGRLGSTLLIKLRTNISFSIRAILIPHTDQGHSDYYTLLKINSGNGLVPDVRCGDEPPSLEPQQEELERKEVARRGGQAPENRPAPRQWAATVCFLSLYRDD